MKAMYFMGVSSGTSKKGNDFYCVNILWQNGFGNLEVKPPLFVDADTFQSVKELDFPRGTAVDIKVNPWRQSGRDHRKQEVYPAVF